MWVIWSKYLLPQALKICPKCNKSPNLVTLIEICSEAIKAQQSKCTIELAYFKLNIWYIPFT